MKWSRASCWLIFSVIVSWSPVPQDREISALPLWTNSRLNGTACAQKTTSWDRRRLGASIRVAACSVRSTTDRTGGRVWMCSHRLGRCGGMSVSTCWHRRGDFSLLALYSRKRVVVPGEAVLSPCLTRMIHQLVGWDKETAVWWAGACELTSHFDHMLCWVGLPFPPAHHGLTHAGPTLRESSRPTPVA